VGGKNLRLIDWGKGKGKLRGNKYQKDVYPRKETKRPYIGIKRKGGEWREMKE